MIEALRREIDDPRVLDAMVQVPRERFVPREARDHAYEDRALGIGYGQTISQPLIVALMIQALQLLPHDRVLELGTGSGYETAVLSKLAREVHSVERIGALLDRARELLAGLRTDNVVLHLAGETLGDPAHGSFDAILVAAGAPHVPRSLIDQLAEGGRLVIPIGDLRAQQLVRAAKTPHGLELARLCPCGFVPLIGREAWPDRPVATMAHDAGDAP
jgi:protein-L-isoaspartate(D-aspartate) O-methyltransferase